jgi:hypothetical protein
MALSLEDPLRRNAKPTERIERIERCVAISIPGTLR